MIIEKIKLKNFRKFEGEHVIEFNEDINVLIGDNEAGKSTILMALDLILSGSQRKVDAIGLENLFNASVIDNFLKEERSYDKLPELYIEIYLKDTGISDLNGENYSEGSNKPKDGLRFECIPNDEYSKEISYIIEDNKAIFPFEYYNCNFRTFAKNPYNGYRKYIKHVLIDNSLINNEYAMKEYTISLYNSYTDNKIRNNHKIEYRKLKDYFTSNILKDFNEDLKEVKFGLNNNNKMNLENNLAIYENDINICNKGSGRQCMIKTEYALNKQRENIDIILIEEPENHLSYINMKKLLNEISKTSDKQIFVTTHSSTICSRLNLKKVICMNSNSINPIEFKNISEDTSDFFIKSPSSDILRFILSKKVILVEGAAEYILLEKFYELIEKEKIDNNGISIISVNGLSFLRYLEIAEKLKIKVAIITDNDGDYNENVYNKYIDYKDIENISVFSDTDNNNKTFEISLYNSNINYIENKRITTSNNKQRFMLNNKSENAYRILKELEKINGEKGFKVPEYIERAIKWIKS